MSTQTEPPRPPFQLSMLLNDTRYRGLTFQGIALVILISAIWYLANNLFTNLEVAGLELSYVFLEAPAGYDINQQPIEYDNQETHLRAAFIGIVNTLIVALLACVTATLLGVIAGVLRLSPNWLVRKLMSIYVEMFRNIPVLIWILIIFGIFNLVPLPPAAFRGDEPASTPFLGLIAFTNQGVFVPALEFTRGLGSATMIPQGFDNPYILDVFGWFNWNISRTLMLLALVAGLIPMYFARRWALGPDGSSGPLSQMPGAVRVLFSAIAFLLPIILMYVLLLSLNGSEPIPDLRVKFNLSAWSIILAICVGLVISGMISRWADRKQEVTGERPVVWWMKLLVIFGPAIILMVIYGTKLDVPTMARFRFEGGITLRASLLALWLALAVYTGAFIAENVRAGILAVSKGQTEAASALGLKPNMTMRLVVLPQALRVIVPPLISQYLNITKNTSLAIAVGYMDITATLGGITLNQTGRAIEAVSLLMLFYLTISLLISAAMNVYNKSIELKER